MKLRLEKETVKLRLSSDEIRTLQIEKYLTEEFVISRENRFNYSIHIANQSDTCLVQFNSQSLEITVPEVVADKWMNSNQVGIKETIVTIDGGKIDLFVEEDLPPRKNREKK